MSTHDRHRLDRRTAEQLLTGAPVGGARPLNDLLAAAAAPGRDGELAGEQAAVAAFQAARLEPATQARRPMLKTLLTTRFAAATVAALVTAGGVATAAATGYLQNPLRGNPTVAPTPATTSATSSSTSAEHGASSSAGTPSPSLTGLCNAYTAGAGSEHGKALDSPAFGALIAAAGGKDKVDAYCATVLADKSDKDGPPGKADPPGQSDVDHGNQGHEPKGNGQNGNGNGPPTKDPGPDHPTGSPTTHPGH